ncbi:MAG TPA: M14 metallopeptidase family protein [Bryobacterales bacterium]|nr:M14 metallopeptidase family protein [Bryobacterales bacterium]
MLRQIRAVCLCVCVALAARPLAAAVPTPESFFGHKIGADRTMLDWSKVVDYFRRLEKSSDRIRVEELGKTTEGRPFILAIIAAPETLRNLDHYRQIQARLADPSLTNAAEAGQLIAEGKSIVLITCSIHSTEIASTHTSVEFAYKLLTEDTPRHRAILANDIFLLVPSLNPDGVDIVTRWYRQQLGTPYDGTAPPELYHKYVGHDNNRDWYMFTQTETRLAVGKIHNVWHPLIVYDVHQMGPNAARIFVPPWLDPIEPNIDPVIAQEVNMVGTAMAADLTAAGKKGVVINAMYDYWSPARHYQSFHGGLRILSESASARLATPIHVSRDQLDTNALGYNARERSWNFLEPWPGGDWHLRDIIDYQLIALESCLYQAALRREDLLRNFYGIGLRAVNRRDPPYAFVIPRRQHDPNAMTRLLQTLEFGMVEIERAVRPFRAGARDYQPGDYVIRLSQPYESFAKALLERQHYPDLREYPGGPPKRPYDVTAHTLPLLLGVRADAIESPFDASLERVSTIEPEPGVVQDVSMLALSPALTNCWIAVNRLLKAGANVSRLPADGTFLVENSGPVKSLLPSMARDLGLPFTAIHLRDTGGKLRPPRIGLYKSYVPNMDEGWTRWILEQFDFPYASLLNGDIRAGHLLDKLDVIILPDATAPTMESGFRPGSMPPEFTGGLGDAGAAALQEFAAGGGTILAFNRASAYAIERLGAGARNVLAGVPNREFYAPGSLLEATVDKSHPLGYGMEDRVAVWFESGPVFEPAFDGPNPPAVPVLKYPPGNPLVSGWLLGPKLIENRAAVMDAPVGKGHIILFGMRPQYRAQSYATFKLFFNGLFAYLRNVIPQAMM